MKRAALAGGACAALLVVLALVAGRRIDDRSVEPTAAPAPALAAGTAAEDESTESSRGFLFGRITTVGGGSYEGRLRWGRGEEAFWGDFFNGVRFENPWLALVPPERLPRVSRPLRIFGLEIARREHPVVPGRIFQARFGDLARIESRGREVRVELKSGSELVLDRLEASDFDDGVRVWDRDRGVVDLEPLRIRTIELLPATRLADAPVRLHGRVRTRQTVFSGFVRWNLENALGSDELVGRTADGVLALRCDSLRALERAGDGLRVTLVDGREVALAGTPEVGSGNRGVEVDDPRFGRVRVSWDAFERLDFDEPGRAGSGPAYDDFPPGRPLTGSVTTRSGRRLAGRLVFDLDESETTDTLDASADGVDYFVPIGLIARIARPARDAGTDSRVRVILHSGEPLTLDRTGDLREENAGLLIFADGHDRAEYVPWPEVERIDLDRPAAMHPPLDARSVPGPATSPGVRDEPRSPWPTST
jgi:hypothetical protein